MKSPGIILVIALIAVCPVISRATDTETSPVLTSHIPRQRVDSSAITEIGYSKRRHWLEIKFASGAIYRYIDVPPSVYRDLISAESKARYYDLNIKKNYRSVRVRPRVKDEAAN